MSIASFLGSWRKTKNHLERRAPGRCTRAVWCRPGGASCHATGWLGWIVRWHDGSTSCVGRGKEGGPNALTTHQLVDLRAEPSPPRAVEGLRGGGSAPNSAASAGQQRRQSPMPSPSRLSGRADAGCLSGRQVPAGLRARERFGDNAAVPTTHRFPAPRASAFRGFRSHLPLRGSSGVAPDSLLSPNRSPGTSTPGAIGPAHWSCQEA